MLYLKMAQWRWENQNCTDRKTIDHVFVTNTHGEEQPRAARKVVKAIEEADMVVLGPGSHKYFA